MEYSVLIRPDMLAHHFSESQQAIKNILKKSNQPSDINYNLFRQENFRKKLLENQPTEIQLKPVPSSAQPVVEEPKTFEVSKVIGSLPKSFQTKGRDFISHVQQIPDLEIFHDGKLSYKGLPVVGANFRELVHDFVRNRRSKSPAKGSGVLLDILKESNIPAGLIGNTSKRAILNPSNPSTPKTKKRKQYGTGRNITLQKALKRLKWKEF